MNISQPRAVVDVYTAGTVQNVERELITVLPWWSRSCRLPLDAPASRAASAQQVAHTAHRAQASPAFRKQAAKLATQVGNVHIHDPALPGRRSPPNSIEQRLSGHRLSPLVKEQAQDPGFLKRQHTATPGGADLQAPQLEAAPGKHVLLGSLLRQLAQPPLQLGGTPGFLEILVAACQIAAWKKLPLPVGDQDRARNIKAGTPARVGEIPGQQQGSRNQISVEFALIQGPG
jgi:hypothetical protein